MPERRPAVFLDRDGTIVREVDYLRSPEQLRLLPRAAAAIKRLNEAGFAVVVTTNQAGIARGILTEADLALVNDLLRRRLARQGARLDAIYFCPHHPEVGPPEYRKQCECRKPGPGMLLCAAKDLGVDLTRSFAVGDTTRDLLAGRAAGCRAVLVRTGYGRETEAKERDNLPADFVADDLAGAVEWIVGLIGQEPLDFAPSTLLGTSRGKQAPAERRPGRVTGQELAPAEQGPRRDRP
jgi:D-glycero-D-manno-heptose 1,7-bisphosphate phosphatase